MQGHVLDNWAANALNNSTSFRDVDNDDDDDDDDAEEEDMEAGVLVSCRVEETGGLACSSKQRPAITLKHRNLQSKYTTGDFFGIGTC